jgi:hypothetical protein
MTDTIHSMNYNSLTTPGIQEEKSAFLKNAELQTKVLPRELQIRGVMAEITSLLLSKNAAYGDSALTPSNVFSKQPSIEGIKLRIDDKLTRIKNKGITDQTEDTISDLIGYLVLLKIALKEQ